jgi:pyruvate kinase
VLEGTDAVMLSGETAMGLFPVEAVKMMKRVILYTEREDRAVDSNRTTAEIGQERVNAISAAAVVLARELPAKVIIAETSSGQTARNISAQRPGVPVIIVTDHERVYYQMAIVWGGKSYLASDMNGASDDVLQQLRTAGNVHKGDAAVIVSGNQPGLIGGTNRVEIKVVS